MAVKIKESAASQQSAAYQPRFNFGTNPDPAGKQIGTIKELIAELNQERSDNSGSAYDIKSLGTVLRFLSAITGKEYRSITEIHPLSTLKTIKLLHRESRYIDAHLIKLLEFPEGDSHGMMDILTMQSSPEAEDVKRQKNRIIAGLETEIDQVEIEQINAISDHRKLRENYRRDTNGAVDDILLTHIHIEDELLKDADDYLAEKTRQFHSLISPLKREPRAHVATCVYLKILDYVHRLHFQLATKLSIPHDPPISNMSVSFEKIRADISTQLDRDILKYTNFLSIYEMGDFCEQHMAPLVEIVTKASGFNYDNRAFKQDIDRAITVMLLYFAHGKLPVDPESRPIGIAHVVAAFTSVLHQRNNKANLVKRSTKYSPRIDPQRQLDLLIKGETQDIPWTVQYLYSERMRCYLYAMLGRKDMADSHKSLQLAQSELMRDVFLSLSPDRIVKHISIYRDWMIEAANDFVIAHGRQHIRYVKIRNY